MRVRFDRFERTHFDFKLQKFNSLAGRHEVAVMNGVIVKRIFLLRIMAFMEAEQTCFLLYPHPILQIVLVAQ